ncbi:hypothetical protein NL676_029456 [Syzygium grande]|nr:hypothetical protein NL676_029456 [Syzygium grande]
MPSGGLGLPRWVASRPIWWLQASLALGGGSGDERQPTGVTWAGQGEPGSQHRDRFEGGEAHGPTPRPRLGTWPAYYNKYKAPGVVRHSKINARRMQGQRGVGFREPAWRRTGRQAAGDGWLAGEGRSPRHAAIQIKEAASGAWGKPGGGEATGWDK